MNEPSLLGQVYGDVKHKYLLHLAMLLHDMGKGFEEDHCIVGGQIAAAVAERLHLKESHGDRLVLLVEKHLMMSHLAFRRNINDINVILPFTREVGSLDMPADAVRANRCGYPCRRADHVERLEGRTAR